MTIRKLAVAVLLALILGVGGGLALLSVFEPPRPSVVDPIELRRDPEPKESGSDRPGDRKPGPRDKPGPDRQPGPDPDHPDPLPPPDDGGAAPVPAPAPAPAGSGDDDDDDDDGGDTDDGGTDD